ncbi:hypothetical protein G7Y79_00014g036050 [Physcia stellaris]|nr:hypothetical protein G7Y79_00014g036050 [Physcia stellaris]
MARFSDLPAELLLLILEYLQPAGADAFCMLSKHVRAVAAPFLEKHMELKRAYTNCVHCSKAYFDLGDRKPANLLREILRKSEIMPYVQRLLIKDYAHRVDDLMDDFYYAGSETPNHSLEILSQAIEKCDLIGCQSLKTEWIKYLREGGENATNVLLLSMLPNLVALRLDNGGDKYSIDYVMNKISQKIGTATLAQVSVIELSEEDPLVRHYNRALVFFSLLPSLKRLSALKLSTEGSDDRDSYRTHSPSIHTSSNPPSRLTHLSFANCRIHPSTWSALLSNTTSLISFKYCSNAETPIIGEGEAEWLCKALLAFAKHTLRQLTLYTWDDSPMGSLREFKALDSLSTRLQLLHRSKVGLSSMTKSLPRTLEQLKVRKYYRWDALDYYNFMDRLLRIKDQEVPKLKMVQYMFDGVHYSSSDRRMIEGYINEKHFANAGVQIKLNWVSHQKLEEDLEVLEGSTLVDNIEMY